MIDIYSISIPRTGSTFIWQILSEIIAGTDIRKFYVDYITKIVTYNYCQNLDKLLLIKS